MDEHKAKVEALKAEIAEIRANADLSELEKARKVLELKGQLEIAQGELAEVTAAAEALAALDGEGDEDEAGDEGAGEGEEAPAEVPAEVPAPAEAPAEPVALAASASDADASPTAEVAEVRPMVTLTASANVGNTPSGTVLGQTDVLSMLKASSTMREGRTRMFTMNRFAEGAESLDQTKSAFENSRIMREAAQAGQKPLALTAAACFCGPDEVDPTVDVLGSRARPVAGIFPSVPINGGFRYLPDLAINPDSGSVNIWTCADQDLVDPDDSDTWKACSELDCFTEQEALPYMITGCTIVNRQHQWAHPEQVRAWLDKLMVEYARKAETALLDIIHANAVNPLSVGADEGGLECYGIKAQVEYALASLSFALGFQFRADALAGHTVIAPRGLVDAMVADEHIRGFDHGQRRSEILGMFADYGVTLVERLDEATALTAAAQATVTALNAGGQIDLDSEPLRQNPTRLYVLRPDQWVHAEGTLVSADWHVDTPLLRQNKMLYFWENLELLEHVGLERAYAVDIHGLINGARADLVTPPCNAD